MSSTIITKPPPVPLELDLADLGYVKLQSEVDEEEAAARDLRQRANKSSSDRLWEQAEEHDIDADHARAAVSRATTRFEKRIAEFCLERDLPEHVRQAMARHLGQVGTFPIPADGQPYVLLHIS